MHLLNYALALFVRYSMNVKKRLALECHVRI